MDRNLLGRFLPFVWFVVALRKESVDRNSIVLASFRACILSLSARRAWIEIARFARSVCVRPVALRKESVDRNLCWVLSDSITPRRSPQGERG